MPYVAAMGFDVLYLPPVHPIGRTHRKGPNNHPEAGPGDVGSPWGIGGDAGGHTAVHPDLGTLADFDRLVATARRHGIEVALDIAFQCSPDHPWVKAHPEWFRHRPDGSIQYAENPPKKYQDIYPLNFETPAWRELWEELKRVVLFWADHGVTIFRVDNPHTKPFAFWEWLIREVRAVRPEAIFLSEAFTRPKILRYLAKCGFSQSYTYFTWRNTKPELIEFLTEWNQPAVRQYLRPNFFANTPDILHEFLQTGGRAAHQIRFLLAATLAGNYGIYGPAFELADGRGVSGTEEYQDSEKYQLRHWNLDSPGSLRELIARVNRIRRENRAFRDDTRIRFLEVDNDALLAYVRDTPELDNLILVVVNLDPHHPQTGWLRVPCEQFGLERDRPYQVHDLLSDARYLWHGERNYVALDPGALPAHIFRVRRHLKTERDFDYYA
ncbi:MAG TPA: alpha-amylase family glycosyl hydrolase [Gemmatimonadales bacterium]|nr:alpha-amylase family glycosyl hydrolase [Gemmatimonadales bacterium]